MSTTRTYYLFIPKWNGFSSIYGETLEEVKQKRTEWGECPNGTPENKAYWQDQMKGGKIIKVTEIREDVEG